MPLVITKKQHGIFIITINRPEKMNCIDEHTGGLLEQAWIQFRDDDNLRVAIITGSGTQSFCSGADLKNVLALVQEQKIPGSVTPTGNGFLGYTRGCDIYKPILAAINGYALAGGLELACFADIRIAEKHSTFGVSNRRWGVPLIDGGTQRLPRIIGLGRAMELILTGKTIDVNEAYRIGLVNEIVDETKSLSRCIEIAEMLIEFPYDGMRYDKESVYRGIGQTLENGIKIEAEVGFRTLATASTHNGIKSFENRKI